VFVSKVNKYYDVFVTQKKRTMMSLICCQKKKDRRDYDESVAQAKWGNFVL